MEKETSCINSRAILDYLKKHNVDCSSIFMDLDPEIDGLEDPEKFLRNPNNWISCSVISKLYKRARLILHDEKAAYKMGRYASENISLGYAQRIVFKSFWSVRKTFKNAQKINDQWNRNKKVELIELKQNEAIVRLHWNSEMEVTKDICLYNQGAYTSLPLVWGGSPLTLKEKCCYFNGAPHCEYHLKWPLKNKLYETFSRVFTSKSVLMDTIKEMERDKKIIEEKTEKLVNINKELQNEIAERTQIEEMLRESEGRYRETVELLPSIVCEYDTKGRFSYVNTYGLETFGYALSDLDQGLHASQLFPKSELEKFKDRFSLLLKGEKPETTEYRLQHKDGSIIYVIADSSPISKDGKIVGARSSITPITERKRTEEALLKSEEKYRELANSLPQVVFEMDKSGIITYANRNAFDCFGYTENDFDEGINVLQILIPEDRDRAMENIKIRLIGKKLESQEYTAQRKDGSTFPVAVHVNPIVLENRPVGLRGILIDTTERKQAEEELQKLASVIKYSSELVNLATLDGKMIFLNESGCEMLGIDPDEVERIHIMEVIPDHMKELVQNKLLPALMQGNTWEGELQYRNVKTGGLIDVHARTFTVHEPNTRKPLFLANVSMDITDRKLSEEEKNKMEAQLQQAQKMEAIGTLAGGIAHDFNNLLMGIQGRTSLMLMDTESYHPHFEHLRGVEDYVKRAADLTKQLLAFARGGKYEVKPTDLNELINKSSEMFGRTKKEITIHNKRQVNIWVVEVDQSQLEQVLLNLYVNAWQSMPGGGDLYLETENVMLDADYVKPYSIAPGKYVKIVVTDTGAGMDKPTRERIFDPFFTTKEMGRGTGLGLASAYGIIKNHNGIINVYSEIGEGTTFNIYLPASEKEVIRELELDKEIEKGEETVLLVDDEDMITDVGKELLKKMGYKVLIAKGGKAAVELYEANKDEIDIVILDMIMPDMGGGDTYDKLKEIDSDIKVLLSSGYSVDGQATAILERGCNGFVQKPFNMLYLSQKIREILDRDQAD